MNRDDRSTLIDLGCQFTPALFEGLDPATCEDEHLISVVGNAFSQLSSSAGTPAATHDPSQPDRDVIEKWMRRHTFKVSDHKMDIVRADDGRRTRVYTPIERDATIDDCLSWRLDEAANVLHLVMSDGTAGAHEWKRDKR